jgi:hypothetical protein
LTTSSFFDFKFFLLQAGNQSKMQPRALLSLLALASTSLCSPVAAPVAMPVPEAAAATGKAIVADDLATAVGGAMAIQTFAPQAAAIAPGPALLTITVINSHGDAISTSHVHAADSPSAVSGNVGPGTSECLQISSSLEIEVFW